MKSVIRLVSVILVALFASGIAQSDNKYTGVKMCGACHKAGKAGTAFAVWSASPHAKAYETLLGDAAKKIAKEKGLKGAPSESPECLKCHVTGGGAAKNVEASFKKEEGVTCEACHGAASGYRMLHSKGDLAKSKAAGLNPGEKTAKACETCHNSDSPTFKGFKLEAMWAKIEHGLPKK